MTDLISRLAHDTTFHGLSDYSHFYSRTGKILWSVFLIIIFTLFIVQTGFLLNGYLRGDVYTRVVLETNGSLPNIVIRQYAEVLQDQDIEDAGILDNYEGPERLWLKRFITGALLWGDRCMSKKYDFDQGTFNNETKYQLALNMTRENFKTILKNYGSLSALYLELAPVMFLDAYLNYFQFTAKTGRNIIQGDQLDHLRSQYLEKKMIMGTRGPSHVLKLSKIHAQDAQEVIILISCGTAQSYHLDFTSLEYRLDRNDRGLRLDCSSSKIISVTPYKHTLAAHTCREEEEPYSCETKCWIRKAASGKKCLPYLGESELTVGIPVCEIDSPSQCSIDDLNECKKECEKCTNCKPCTTTSASIHIDQDLQRARLNGTSMLMLHFRNEHIVHYIDTTIENTARLIANLGGTLALFFGASLITIVQLILSLTRSVISKSKRSRRQVGGGHGASRISQCISRIRTIREMVPKGRPGKSADEAPRV